MKNLTFKYNTETHSKIVNKMNELKERYNIESNEELLLQLLYYITDSEKQKDIDLLKSLFFKDYTVSEKLFRYK